MSASLSGGRLKSVRLSDIPYGVRLDAYDKLIKTQGSKDGILVASWSLSEQVALGIAAEQPSEQVYWVPLDAWESAVRSRAWRLAAARETS
jgi:predicted oxidoreductase (fatty acid repression mutant protein)